MNASISPTEGLLLSDSLREKNDPDFDQFAEIHNENHILYGQFWEQRNNFHWSTMESEFHTPQLEIRLCTKCGYIYTDMSGTNEVRISFGTILQISLVCQWISVELTAL